MDSIGYGMTVTVSPFVWSDPWCSSESRSRSVVSVMLDAGSEESNSSTSSSRKPISVKMFLRSAAWFFLFFFLSFTPFILTTLTLFRFFSPIYYYFLFCHDLFINDQQTIQQLHSIKLNLQSFILYTFIFILSFTCALLSTNRTTHFRRKKRFFSIESSSISFSSVLPLLDYVANNAFFGIY